MTKKRIAALRLSSKPSALLWGTKVPVVANIARTQWHLRLVNCAFSGFASLKIALFIHFHIKEEFDKAYRCVTLVFKAFGTPLGN